MTTPPTSPTPYGTPDAPHIAVRGEARIEVPPELARIAVTVTARGSNRRATLDDLTRRNTAALDLIKSHEHAIDKLHTGALVITPELGKGRGERIRAHHGHVRIEATLTDFTALGELTTRLADLDLTRIDGPWWSLRTDSTAHATARTQAVHDAVRRAQQYATALGARLVALTELADEGLDTTTTLVHGPRYGTAIAGAPRGAEPETTPALDLEPQPQLVQTHVTAHFTMTPPDLGQ
ncbi:SIMPL domain-containing protein [Streptomyces sp. RB6PN25]|uniref:SIMPL domain-containing protein n=1 Tax=Streptomyces humicola TaxID=2953240 RepID=A0ABT1PUV9_9ACTN|nr:SIMPL domain-containing protein [Streptomyces humicola]MCQ4081463.1 SIMPL domain-containing protein [Streptomyces humicola]